MATKQENRLDAVESLFFQRELEHVEQTAYKQPLADLKARSLIPSITGVSEADEVYTWRKFSGTASSKRIGHGDTQDLPRAEATGAENSTKIIRLGNSYGYSVFEIKAAAKVGRPLEEMRAFYARRGLEEDVDNILANGDGVLEGLLTLSEANAYTLSTKAAGGLTWGTVGAPNATAQEIVADLMGMAAARHAATKGLYTRFTIVLPIEQYNLAAQLPMGTGADTTPLKFALANSPYIAEVVPWHKCDGAGAGSTARMVCYPKDPTVLGCLVPQEFTTMAPQLKDFEYRIPCFMSTGGVICRYPVACAYADGL